MLWVVEYIYVRLDYLNHPDANVVYLFQKRVTILQYKYYAVHTYIQTIVILIPFF